MFFSGDIKEKKRKKSSEKKKKKALKKKKKSSENDQLTGHFQSFFIIFFRPPNPKSEINSRKSTNKNSGLINSLHAGKFFTLICHKLIHFKI